MAFRVDCADAYAERSKASGVTIDQAGIARGMTRAKEAKPMKFYGQFKPPVDKVLFRLYKDFLRSGPGYFVESGAFDGITESNCKFLEESLGWRGINVEPFPHHFQKLIQNRPNALNFNCALSSENGTQTFTHVSHPRFGDNFGNGSLSHTSHHQQLLRQSGCVFRKINVPTMTFDRLIETAGVPRVDLLSLDVEGHELNVLQGMQKEEYFPRIICIETGHDPDEDIDRRLHEMGYTKDGEYEVNSFYWRAA